MIFTPTTIHGMFSVDLEPRIDERGFFVRQFAEEEYLKAEINFKMVQTNQAFTKLKGTLRGMHWQVEPKLESKVFQCLEGEIYDAVIDMRSDSPTFLKSFGIKLSGDMFKLLYLPGGLAHGYQTLKDNTKVQYMVSEFYSPECEKGIRWNDPYFKIDWPLSPSFISEKDSSFPNYKSP